MYETYTIDSKGHPTIYKDPKATLDYTFDWSVYLTALNNDNISPTQGSVTFTVDTLSGTSIASQSNTSTTATVWIAGGISGSTATVTCQIKTVGGRTEDRLIYIKLREL